MARFGCSFEKMFVVVVVLFILDCFDLLVLCVRACVPSRVCVCFCCCFFSLEEELLFLFRGEGVISFIMHDSLENGTYKKIMLILLHLFCCFVSPIYS